MILKLKSFLSLVVTTGMNSHFNFRSRDQNLIDFLGRKILTEVSSTHGFERWHAFTIGLYDFVVPSKIPVEYQMSNIEESRQDLF